jgi:hypothetical protein
VAANHQGSEMAGVIFDPSGKRMYFSSQRAYPYVPGTPAADGALFMVEGRFRVPQGGPPPGWVYGPPAGERPDGASYLTPAVPGLSVDAPAALTGASLPLRIGIERDSTVHLVLRSFDLGTESSGNATHDRPVPVTLASSQETLPAGQHDRSLTLDAAALARLVGRSNVAGILTAVAIDSAGKQAVVARRVTLA